MRLALGLGLCVLVPLLGSSGICWWLFWGRRGPRTVWPQGGARCGASSRAATARKEVEFALEPGERDHDFLALTLMPAFRTSAQSQSSPKT